jgi:hypothetical protein
VIVLIIDSRLSSDSVDVAIVESQAIRLHLPPTFSSKGARRCKGSDAFAPVVAIMSTADFNCDASNATKPEGVCTSRRKIYYSAAHEWATIIYPDNDRPAVADVCYPNFCSERESAMCGGQGIRSYAFAVRGPRAAAGVVNGSDAGLYNRGTICGRNCREANAQGGYGQSESQH